MIRERGGRPKDFIAVSLAILFFAGSVLCHCPFLFATAGIVALLGWRKGTRGERGMIALLASISLACAIYAFIAEARLQTRVNGVRGKNTKPMAQPTKP